MVFLACATATAAQDDVPIAFGQTLNGDLGPADRRAGDGSYYDVYRFSGQAGQRVIIELKSRAFDAYLTLTPADSDERMRTDDDSGGGTNARIAATLPEKGEYLILANSVEKGETGRYSLSLSTRPPPRSDVPTPKALALGQTLKGELSRSDALADDYSFYDLYRFSGQAGDRVAIDLKSTAFDAYVSIHAPGSPEELAFDDDGGGNNDSRVVYTLPAAGEYDVRANAMQEGERGRYTIHLDRAPAETIQTIAFGETAKGELANGDPRASDGSFYDLYRFTGFEGEQIAITMRSQRVDSFLSLHVPGQAAPFASDDDSGGGEDARLVITLRSTAQFEIRANSVSRDETGPYTLTLERLGASGPTRPVADAQGVPKGG